MDFPKASILLLLVCVSSASLTCGPGGVLCPSGNCQYPTYIEGCSTYASASVCAECEYSTIVCKHRLRSSSRHLHLLTTYWLFLMLQGIPPFRRMFPMCKRTRPCQWSLQRQKNCWMSRKILHWLLHQLCSWVWTYWRNLFKKNCRMYFLFFHWSLPKLWKRIHSIRLSLYPWIILQYHNPRMFSSIRFRLRWLCWRIQTSSRWNMQTRCFRRMLKIHINWNLCSL